MMQKKYLRVKEEAVSVTAQSADVQEGFWILYLYDSCVFYVSVTGFWSFGERKAAAVCHKAIQGNMGTSKPPT